MFSAFFKADTKIFFLLIVFSLFVASCGSSSGGGGLPLPPGGNPLGNEPVVFIANADMVMQFELFASFDNGDEIIKLSAPLINLGNVVEFEVSPDGLWVAYKADQEEDDKFELYVVPITGGVPVNVSRRFGEITEVEDFDWSPNSFWIAFRAFNPLSGPTGGNIELFTNQPDGNSSAKVSIAPVQGQEVREFAWAPDSQQLAYTVNVNQILPDKFELYTTSPGSQDNILITSVLPDFADVKDIDWSPDSDWIAFLADILIVDVNELFAAKPSSPAGLLVPISGTLVNGGQVGSFAWAPDSSRVAFLANKDVNNQIELYSVQPNGDDLEEVSDLGASGNVIAFAWAPDASLLAYTANPDPITAAFELFTARPDGSFSSIKISGASIEGDVDTFHWAPNSDYIAYRADQDVIDRLELYVALPGVADSGLKVSGPMAPALPNGNVVDFAWSPDSSRVAYRADQVSANQVELFSSTPDGGINDVVSGPLVSGGSVEAPDPPFSGAAFIWSPDSERIAYRADQDTNEVFELFTSEPNGSNNTLISGVLAVGGDVQTFAWGSAAFR
jgi:Tol biopolymer transport system component